MPKISDERRAARRKQIIEGAWACFQRQGLHATTMDDIIRAAGLSAGAVYSYFPGKEELIHAAVTTSLGDLRALVGEVFATRPLPPPAEFVGQVAAVVAGYTARDGYDLRRIALLGWSEAQRNERLREVMRDYYLEFRAGLEAAARQWLADGALPEGAAAEDVSKALLSTILGFVVQSALLGDVTPEALAAGLRDTMGRGDRA